MRPSFLSVHDKFIFWIGVGNEEKKKKGKRKGKENLVIVPNYFYQAEYFILLVGWLAFLWKSKVFLRNMLTLTGLLQELRVALQVLQEVLRCKLGCREPLQR